LDLPTIGGTIEETPFHWRNKKPFAESAKGPAIPRAANHGHHRHGGHVGQQSGGQSAAHPGGQLGSSQQLKTGVDAWPLLRFSGQQFGQGSSSPVIGQTKPVALAYTKPPATARGNSNRIAHTHFGMAYLL
jgi:hypothetical protein